MVFAANFIAFEDCHTAIDMPEEGKDVVKMTLLVYSCLAV